MKTKEIYNVHFTGTSGDLNERAMFLKDFGEKCIRKRIQNLDYGAFSLEFGNGAQVIQEFENSDGKVTERLIKIQGERLYINLDWQHYDDSCSVDVYSVDRKSAKRVLDILSTVPKVVKKEEKYIYLMLTKNEKLDTTAFKTKRTPTDIGLNYGEDFVPVYETILSALHDEDKSGIMLFHGVPGTGKTSLVKNLVHQTTRKMIMLSATMGGALGSPDFMGFMINNKNCVLVIEDAEKLLVSREGINNSLSIGNILNLSDGIMGDCLGIQIIATFNTKKENIDEALLRKGRLIVDHEFKPLSIKDSNRLLAELGKSYIATQPMTLADIYTIEKKVYKSEEKRQIVGFKL
jgi:hypothetical protein